MQTLPPTGAQYVDGAAMLGRQAIGVPIDVVGQGLIAHVHVGPRERDVQLAAHAHALGLGKAVVPGKVVGDEMFEQVGHRQILEIAVTLDAHRVAQHPEARGHVTSDIHFTGHVA